jgi:peptidoglycan/xylan/chitin deacetylase (PgdA/CDA1 family)
MIFISSWDDGHPCDERIAELLQKFRLKGTFYLPIRNRESRPVLNASAAKALATHFEIGSHTLDHQYLNNMGKEEIDRQLIGGKEQLEDILGRRVDAFCYPGGRFSGYIKETVKRIGFRSARTVENLRLDGGTDPFSIPTTLQFFPHRGSAILRNYIKRGHYGLRASALMAYLSKDDWTQSMMAVLKTCSETDGIFHLWGHSWEIDEFDLWRRLDEFLSAVVESNPTTMTVSGLISIDGASR